MTSHTAASDPYLRFVTCCYPSGILNDSCLCISGKSKVLHSDTKYLDFFLKKSMVYVYHLLQEFRDNLMNFLVIL